MSQEAKKLLFMNEDIRLVDFIQCDGSNAIPLHFFKGANHTYKFSWRMSLDWSNVYDDGKWYGILGNIHQLPNGQYQRLYMSYNSGTMHVHAGDGGSCFSVGINRSNSQDVWLSCIWEIPSNSLARFEARTDNGDVFATKSGYGTALQQYSSYDWSTFSFYVLGNVSDVVGFAGSRFSFFKIEVDGTIVYDLHPAIKAGDLGMYCTTTRQFFIAERIQA